MNKIIKVFKDHAPAMRFICKKYGDYNHWGEWFSNGWFDVIEAAMGGVENINKIWANGGGYVGLERRGKGKFEYAIGMFTPEGTPVPEGFDFIDFPICHFGTCWIYGKEDEVHDTSACIDQLVLNGMELLFDEDNCITHFENGLCPRFTTPDEDGNVILDYCYLVK